jgi:hypothetical protein
MKRKKSRDEIFHHPRSKPLDAEQLAELIDRLRLPPVANYIGDVAIALSELLRPIQGDLDKEEREGDTLSRMPFV